MTMDISSRRKEPLNEEAISTKTSSTTTTKRPFDVAFLMLPDEKLLKARQKQALSKHHAEEIVGGVHHQAVRKTPVKPPVVPSEQRSAFSKVNLGKGRISPNLPPSPDLNYQNSLSPSPPILPRNYANAANFPQIPQLLKSQAYQNPLIQENFNFSSTPSGSTLDVAFLQKTRSHFQPYNYPQFQPQEMLKPAELKFPPAAALFTTLLPPSFAALSLPAQNICAKCNISFRMTSDLVYHMRSHHKNDAVDMTRKRREDKLKCPVCSESFRERHHLTRHMTAHQDKDEDEDEAPPKKKSFVFTK